ncbi:hypothetical protein ACF0H5_001003 [Mactra antiquata]
MAEKNDRARRRKSVAHVLFYIDEDEKENKPFREKLKNLAESSSLHGIPKIVSSRQIAVKVLWCLLFLATFAVLTYQLVSLFRTYYSYPIQTSVSLEFNAIPYPAISICNMNPVKASKLNQSDELQELLNLVPTGTAGRRRRDIRDTPPDDVKQRKDKNKKKVDKTSNTNTDTTHQTVDDVKELDQDSIKSDIPTKESKQRERNSNEDNEMSQWDTVDQLILPSDVTFTEAHWKTDKMPEGVRRRKRQASYSVLSQSSSAAGSSGGSISGVGSGTGSGSSYGKSSGSCYSSSSSYSSSYHGSYSSSYDYWSEWYSWWNEYYYSDEYGTGSFDYWDNYFALSTSRKDVWEQRVEDVKSIFRNTSLEQRLEIGHQKEDLFLIPLFAGQIQNSSRWKSFSSSDYGNCYTIAAPKYIAWRSGPSHGFKLTLNLEIDEYIANFTTGYGLRLVFHEPGTHPLPSKDGITLSPGTETNIGLRTVKISRLGQPHGDCDTGSEFENAYRVKYSLTACYEFCRIKATIDVCSCLLPDAPDGMHFSTTVVRVCNSSSTSTDSKCVFDLSIKLNEGAYECNCREPCNEFIYTKTMSSTYWPTDDYLKILLTDICSEKRTTTLWKDVCDNLENIEYYDIERIRKNFVRVLIYFEDLNYEQITEDPLYQGVRFLSDIGGAMGLFLGASVLSLVEFAQLVLEIILHLRVKCSSYKDNGRVSSLKFGERT